MAFEFKFPDIGEGLTEGEIVRWLVKEGDEVKEGQPLVEVETDKALAEIPSPKTGVILKILAKENCKSRPGDCRLWRERRGIGCSASKTQISGCSG
jgi:pyruvate dehydrogenase E2 component (dihydrolipoamide acetyltransferase)